MDTLLVIEDDAHVRSDLLELLEAEGYRGIGAADGKQGVELALRAPPDLVICDVSTPAIDGHEVQELLSLRPATASIPFIFLSARPDRVDVQRGASREADEYLTKPFTRLELLDSIRARLQRDRESPRAERSSEVQTKPVTAPASRELVIEEPKLHRLVAQLERVARGPISVLMLGEPGTGKRRLAEHVHDSSGRSGSFVVFRCAGSDELSLESELFGREAGAFPGASEAREGLLELANGGTLFLEEVGELPPAMQVKLLRVLEERRVLRVGGRRARRIDLRLISATHHDLDRAVQQGRFRADLYYRLDGFSLSVPPLRERPADLEALARYFVANAPRAPERHEPPELSDAVMQVLAGYAWPGNVRELRAVLERAVLLCEGAWLLPEHLPGALVKPAPSRGSGTHPIGPHAQLVQDYAKLDRERILDALARCGGNQTLAAGLLGISRRTLVTRLGQYGLPRPRLWGKRGKPG